MPRLGTVLDENTASTLSGGPQPGVEGAAIVRAASFDSAPDEVLRLRTTQVVHHTGLWILCAVLS